MLRNSRYFTQVCIFSQLRSKYPVTQLYFLIMTGWNKDFYWALLHLERVFTKNRVGNKAGGVGEEKYKESFSNTIRALGLLPRITDASFLTFPQKKNKYLCFQIFLTPVSLMPPISTCSHLYLQARIMKFL